MPSTAPAVLAAGTEGRSDKFPDDPDLEPEHQR